MSDSYQIKNQNGVYYLTFQVVGWADIFTREIYREILIDAFIFARKEKNILIFGYVIMSNHIHLIVKRESGNLSSWVRDFKKHTSKKIIQTIFEINESRREWLIMIFKYYAKYNKRNSKYQFWTHENHALEITNNDIFDNKLNYIHQNPVRSSIVTSQEDYLYSSAKNYAKLDCLFDIDAF